MKFTALLSTLVSVLAATSEPEVNENHLTLALDLAKEQGTTVEARDVNTFDIAARDVSQLDKRGFLLLAKLKYLWAMKMSSYNVCYQCGGSICGSSCCSCGSPCQYQCSNC